MTSLIVIAIVIILGIALIGWLIFQNRNDGKQYERDLNNEPYEDQDDDELSDLR